MKGQWHHNRNGQHNPVPTNNVLEELHFEMSFYGFSPRFVNLGYG